MLDPNTVALLNQLGVPAEIVEMAISGLLWFTVVTVVAAIPTAIIAKRKRRSVAGWLVFALSIPLVPLVWILLLPSKSPD